MMDMKNKYGSWCLVAGAGEGLGEAFAFAMAERGIDIILVDQKKDRLESIANRLGSTFGIRTKMIHLDLASEESVRILMKTIIETSCRLIVYNAAFSVVQKFMDNDPADLDRYVRVNMQTPLQLIHFFCDFHSGKHGEKKGIILMSSLAGSWGTQLLAPYGATKAFNHILAESLYHELKADGFEVMACIAGATNTPGYMASNPRGGKISIPLMRPEKVVEASLHSLGNRPFVIPGFRNRLVYFFLSRVLPRRTSLRIMNRSVGQVYRDRL